MNRASVELIVSWIAKAGIFLTGALVALGKLTPEQQADITAWLGSLSGVVASVIAFCVTGYSLWRSIRAKVKGAYDVDGDS